MLLNEYSAKREHDATFLGTTPLTRNLAIKSRGENIIINHPGFETWQGSVSPTASDLHAKLIP